MRNYGGLVKLDLLWNGPNLALQSFLPLPVIAQPCQNGEAGDYEQTKHAAESIELSNMQLKYGAAAQVEYEAREEVGVLRAAASSTPPLTDVAAATTEALEHPLDFPAMGRRLSPVTVSC
ncbi:MAG: hypothetical protein SGJ20_18585 [Planctomycetota bacterium]|nr:hypothetical protein [Planctomycetota bacterium]